MCDGSAHGWLAGDTDGLPGDGGTRSVTAWPMHGGLIDLSVDSNTVTVM